MANISIIGTAGRKNKEFLTFDLWTRMKADVEKRVNFDDCVISGGAAWADHLAVHLFLSKKVKESIFYFPCPFSNGKFEGEYGSSGNTANYYHKLFSKIIGTDSLKEIAQVIEMSKGTFRCNFESLKFDNSGMFKRNLKIAQNCDKMIAYTFGEGLEPDDGGTKHTWDRCSADVKTHVCLKTLRL